MGERAALLAALLCAFACAGRGPAAPAGAAAAAPVLRDAAVLVDGAGTETVSSVAAAPPARWVRAPEIFAAGFTRSVHWMRFTVDAPPGEWWLEVLPPFLDDLRLYEPDPAIPGAFTERLAGCLLPFSAREVGYRGFVFRVFRADEAPRTFYLRLKTDHSSILFPRLWAPGKFLAAKTSVYGILFGNLTLLLAILLVNVGGWLWLREKVHVLLVAYLVGLIAALVGNEGFIAQYLLPSHPAFADSLVAGATHVSVSLGSRFYRHVLLPEGRRGVLPILFHLGFWLPLAALGAQALGYSVEAAKMSSAVVLGMAVLIVPLSFRPWRQGAAGGGFLFAATLIFAAGLVGTTLQFLGFLSSRYALLYSMNVTALAGALTLQAGIGARVLSLRRDRRRALDVAREAAEEARRERSMREQQGKFVDVVAHEYRTPLAILRTNVDILGRTDDPARKVRSLRMMREAIGRLDGLFDDTLRRGDWGRSSPIRHERVDLVALLRGLLAGGATWGSAEERPVDFRPDGDYFLDADADLLKTVFLSLLANAGKYSDPGSAVDVRLARAGTRLEVTIGNACAAGPGLAPELLLQRGTRGANSAGTEGSGTGLHLVKKLVGDLGGNVRLRVDLPGRFEVTVALQGRSREDGA